MGIWRVFGSAQLHNLAARSILVFNSLVGQLSGNTEACNQTSLKKKLCAKVSTAERNMRSKYHRECVGSPGTNTTGKRHKGQRKAQEMIDSRL
eukprot:1159118-Pelagomonas_calceolata.AAC.14